MNYRSKQVGNTVQSVVQGSIMWIYKNGEFVNQQRINNGNQTVNGNVQDLIKVACNTDNIVKITKAEFERLMKKGALLVKITTPYIRKDGEINTRQSYYTVGNEQNKKPSIFVLQEKIDMVSEQYRDIVERLGYGAEEYAWKITYDVNEEVIVFSGKIDTINMKTHFISIRGKEVDAIIDELKSWLFNTLDTIVNVF